MNGVCYCSQEALHGREHEFYNHQLAKQLPITKFLGKVVEFITHGVVPKMGKARALGATVALEHWTALLAGVLLEDEEAMLGGARDTRFGLIWRWHAMEETEHKAVAFDVFERCYGRGIYAYLRRCWSLIISSVIFWTLVPGFFLCLIVQDRSVFNLREWARLLAFLFWRPGALGCSFRPFLDFFRFDYHPWDHNNVDKIAGMEELAKRLAAFDANEDHGEVLSAAAE
jgi:predicted metal-dependent hydrolase